MNYLRKRANRLLIVCSALKMPAFLTAPKCVYNKRVLDHSDAPTRNKLYVLCRLLRRGVDKSRAWARWTYQNFTLAIER